jgi:hypothetical protein
VSVGERLPQTLDAPANRRPGLGVRGGSDLFGFGQRRPCRGTIGTGQLDQATGAKQLGQQRPVIELAQDRLGLGKAGSGFLDATLAKRERGQPADGLGVVAPVRRDAQQRQRLLEGLARAFEIILLEQCVAQEG